MQIGWYLFDKQPFKYFIGISQIICGILLLVNRTVLIGAIIFIPIALNIIIIDLTIMPKELGNSFAIRLGFYIFLDILIFYHYKVQTIEAVKNFTKSVKPKFKQKIWTLIFIPVLSFFLEFSPAIPKVIWGLITDPEKMIKSIKETINIILKNI